MTVAEAIRAYVNEIEGLELYEQEPENIVENVGDLKQAFEADFHNTKIDIDSLVKNGTEIK